MNPRPRGLRVFRDGKLVRDLSVAAPATARGIEHRRHDGELPAPARPREDTRPNDRLEQALREADISREQLASRLGVSRGTVKNWIENGRVPRRVHQFAVERLTGTDLSVLWPDQRHAGASRHSHGNKHLRGALFDSRLTEDHLASLLGVTPGAVNRWTSGGHVPPAHTREAISKLVGVDPARLWPDHRVIERDGTANERLRAAVHAARITPEQFAHALEVDPKTVDRWIAHGVVPTSKHRAMVAESLGVAEDELWRTRALSEQPGGASERMRALMSWVDSAAPVKERDVHPDYERGPITPTTPADPALRPFYRTRGDGLDRTR